MESYKKYRLNNDEELVQYQKDKKRYAQFMNRVYALLDSLKVGESIGVDDVCKQSSLDIFIKCVCSYILYRNPHDVTESFIEFSEDYHTITRQPGVNLGNHYHNRFYDKD